MSAAIFSNTEPDETAAAFNLQYAFAVIVCVALSTAHHAGCGGLLFSVFTAITAFALGCFLMYRAPKAMFFARTRGDANEIRAASFGFVTLAFYGFSVIAALLRVRSGLLSTASGLLLSVLTIRCAVAAVRVVAPSFRRKRRVAQLGCGQHSESSAPVN